MTTTQPTLGPAPRLVVGAEGAPPLRLPIDASRVILSLGLRFVGTVLILCAPGLWVLPGSNADPSLLLWKLGLSVFFVVFGLSLIMWGRGRGRAGPEVQFDPVRREMRILQINDRGQSLGVVRRAYGSLGAARITDREIEILEPDGGTLLRLPISDPGARRALRLQLGDLVR